MHGEDPVGVVAGVHLAEAVQRAQEESGAGDHDDGDGDLRHGERAEQSRVAGRDTASASAHRVGQRAPGQLPGGRESEQDSGAEADDDGERHHAQIEREHQTGRQPALRNEARRHADQDPRQAQSAGAAERGQQDAFGEQLPDQPRAARAERRAHRHFPRPRRAARQHQVGDVGARHQEDEQHQSGKHEGGGAQFRADQGLAQRVDGDAPALVGGGRDLRDARGDPGHRGSRLLDGARPASGGRAPAGSACAAAPDCAGA